MKSTLVLLLLTSLSLFSQTKDEIITKFLNLVEMSGCCIRRASTKAGIAVTPAMLAPWKHRIISSNGPIDICSWKVLTEEEQLVADKLAAEQTEATEKEEAQTQMEREKSAPSELRSMSPYYLCIVYGQAIRGEWIHGIGASKHVETLVRKEVVRRRLGVNVKLVKDKAIQRGMSECSLLASWGHADGSNRTVSAAGVHVQYIYGSFGPYVYTNNGIVAAWQD